jgi:MFS family permease
MPAPLSSKRLAKARNDFYFFNFFNSSSFIFVSGSFLTLFAIKMGASNAVVGIINAIAYTNFFLMPLGKRIVRRKPIVWTFGWGWVARYSALVPVLFAPLLAARGHGGAALGLLIAGVAGFNFFRGVAMISNNPVIGFLAAGGGEKPRSDRGEFMTNNSIISSFASMMSGFLLAIFLGENATPTTYALGIGIGIALGYAGCIFLLRTPEPNDYSPSSSISLIETTKEAMKEAPFRRFIWIFMTLAFVSGMGRSFLPVYAKGVFAQGDDAVMVYSLLASLGAVVMGLLTRLVVDRLGSKPLFIIFSAIGTLSFLPVAFFPAGGSFLASGAVIAVFLALLHFLSAFGFAGEEAAAQTYYFTLVPKEKTMDLSVVYYIAYGIGGTLGSVMGGLLLDGFGNLGLNVSGSYRALYALLCVVAGFCLYRAQKMRSLGSASVSQSLGVMFSIRDLKAFDLLSRLDRSESPSQEMKLIQEIGRSSSMLSQDELLEYLRSPRFQVRREALLAFEAMDHLSPKVLRYLVKETETHTYTTSYLSARILGKHGNDEAIPVLRKAVEAEDYMLQAEAAIALADLGDQDSVPLLESILLRSNNPRVKISSAYALEILHSKSSLPVLASSLRRADPPAFVSDEIVLAMASIMGVMREFYPLYSSFIDDEDQGLALLDSAALDVIVDKRTLEDWRKAIRTLFAKKNPDGGPTAGFIMRTGNDPQTEIVLGEALVDTTLCYRGLKFLAAAYPLFVRRGSGAGSGK